MHESPRGDETLPSLRDYSAAYQLQTRYCLTIIFHPDSARIGERAVLGVDSGETQSIGRHGPGFDAGMPLDDPYLSRCALRIRALEHGLLLQRPAKASPCWLDGEELAGEQVLCAERLRAGVPLLFAHSVVLLLQGVEMPDAGVPPGCDLVGGSDSLQYLRNQIVRAAASQRDVLVRGENGTGKELVARAIHRLSARAGRPFVAVNMAAIPAGLAAASLFGSARGAYTGALREHIGYFPQAQGGTLFLDEVGDTPEEVQPQLLRALQEREIQCVGGPVRRVELRVISATDARLDGAGSNFRSALRYRLGAFEINLPALREHPADIGELLRHFIRETAVLEGREDPLPTAHSRPEVIAAWAQLFYEFSRYHWPGNVRQLANYAAQLLLQQAGQPQLPVALREAFAAQGEDRAVAAAGESPARARLAEVDEDEFRAVMQRCGFETAAVALALGVSRQAVYRRIHRSGEFRLASDIDERELREVLARHRGDVEATARYLQVSPSALRNRLRHAGLAG